MPKLPKELFLIVYQYENTSKRKIGKCIKEIECIKELHRMISVTYNNVVDEQKKYLDFDLIFYIYCLKYNNNPGKKIMFRQLMCDY